VQSPRWVCTRTSKHVGTCVPLVCDIHTKLGANEFQGHLCACLSLYWRLCSHHSPSTYLQSCPFCACLSLYWRLCSNHSPSTYTPLLPLEPNIPRVLFPRPRPLGGDFPPSIMGARRRHPGLERDSADSVCLRGHCYLLHAPLSPHTRPRALTS